MFVKVSCGLMKSCGPLSLYYVALSEFFSWRFFFRTTATLTTTTITKQIFKTSLGTFTKVTGASGMAVVVVILNNQTSLFAVIKN